jgi:molybdopterin-binding protein
MPTYRIKQAAELLGVSDDTVRRWAESGRLSTSTEGSRQVVAGEDLARLAQEIAGSGEQLQPGPVVSASARNRFVGLVTRVLRDTVMAQVEIQAGPHRVVSLMSREAADELDLRVGATAVAVIKSTTVVVERAASRAPHAGKPKTDDAADSANGADGAGSAGSVESADSGASWNRST